MANNDKEVIEQTRIRERIGGFHKNND